MKNLFLTLILAIVFMQVSHGMSQGGEKSFKHHDMQFKWLEALDLTPEQQDQIKAIRSKTKESTKADNEKLNQEHDKLTALFDSNASDDQLISEFDKIQAAKNAVAKDRFTRMLAIRKILTPEQKQKASALLREKYNPKKMHHQNENAEQ